MKFRSNQGFTMVELILVLVILSIATSVVIVSVNRALERSTIKKLTTRVHGTLRYARDTSLMGRTPVSFAIDADNDMFWIQKGDEVLGKVQVIPEGYDLQGQDIIFFPKGNSTGGSIAVIKEEEGGGFVIDVDSVTGSARVTGI